MNCPKCNRPAQGKFCSSCGAPLGQADCPSCGQAVERGARFCHNCGARIGSAKAPAFSVPWVVAGAAVLVLLVVVIVQVRSGPQSSPPFRAPVAAQGAGSPPDLSSMSPREQADRLFNRIMTAHEQGDAEQIGFFINMAVQAYGALGSLDSDARYHLGLIQAVGGMGDAARAQADSLEAGSPGHLFAQMLYAMVAKLANDTEALQRAYRRFVDTYDIEDSSGKPEYLDHQTAVNNFLIEARAALGVS